MKFPDVYQIDRSTISIGRIIPDTKRRVSWRFGYVNTEAIASGQYGAYCRGQEHEVVFVWSILSKKRLVLIDEREIHFSQGDSIDGKITISWKTRHGQSMAIIAHAAQPLKAKPGWEQFDFKIDGKSFSTFTKIYELGIHQGHKKKLKHHEESCDCSL